MVWGSVICFDLEKLLSETFCLDKQSSIRSAVRLHYFFFFALLVPARCS